jgi:hypothetical protein
MTSLIDQWRGPGHASIKMTMDVYGHLSTAREDRAIESLEALSQAPLGTRTNQGLAGDGPPSSGHNVGQVWDAQPGQG